METKTHIGIHFEKGKMYGRNKMSYCWEEMDHVVPKAQYEELLSKLDWKEATLKDGSKFKSIEVFVIQDGEVHGFEDKICNISDLYELK